MREHDAKLPVHGFVLAGGQSSRMGQDKALLRFRGRPMVEIAVEALRSVCAEVSIAGNRDDLLGFAPVVREDRVGTGPTAGIEAGLAAAAKSWAMFVPVDVPMMSAALLQAWAEAVLEKAEVGCDASFLLMEEQRQPAFCMMRRECLATVRAAMETGERRIWGLLTAIGEAGHEGCLWPVDAERFTPVGGKTVLRIWFSNLNTPEDILEAERRAAGTVP